MPDHGKPRTGIIYALCLYVYTAGICICAHTQYMWVYIYIYTHTHTHRHKIVHLFLLLFSYLVICLSIYLFVQAHLQDYSCTGKQSSFNNQLNAPSPCCGTVYPGIPKFCSIPSPIDLMYIYRPTGGSEIPRRLQANSCAGWQR